MLKAKLHHARVTEADLNYEGSLALDEDLMAAADLLPYEKAYVYNVSNGQRFSTYIVKAERGSGKVAVLGAAAHRVRVGDKLIIVAYVVLDEEEIEFYMPKVVLLGPDNKIIHVK
jgi:aspartate 1-decarboxylase